MVSPLAMQCCVYASCTYLGRDFSPFSQARSGHLTPKAYQAGDHPRLEQKNTIYLYTGCTQQHGTYTHELLYTFTDLEGSIEALNFS